MHYRSLEQVQATDVDDETGAAASGPSAKIAFDPVTRKECSDHRFSGSKPYYWHKNRFSTCLSGYDNFYKPPGCWLFCSASMNSFRFVLVGRGDVNYSSGTPVRKLHYDLYTSAGQRYGPSQAPDSTPVTLDVNCWTQVGGTCRSSHPNGVTRTLGSLRDGTRISIDFTVTGNSPDTADKDNKTYHETELTISQPNPDYQPQRVKTDPDPVRCDTSGFNTHPDNKRAKSNGACIFEDIDSELRYSRAAGSPHKAVADHIYDAQKRQSRTKPGIEGTYIYGDHASGRKLYRLVPAWDKAHRDRYNRNTAIAVANCRRYWGPGYATGPGGERRDCDEYPFRSTYEGAAYNEYNGGGTAVSYSSRPINRGQNRSGGATLGRFYNWDHILEEDGYWVEITS